MNKYEQTIQEWNDQGAMNNLAAFHPAGREGKAAFFESGKVDCERVLEAVKKTGLTAPYCNILDYGCGFGRVSYPLAEHFHSVSMWDSSEYVMGGLRAGQIHYGLLEKGNWPDNLHCHCGDTSTPTFDIAFSISVFIHHTYKDGVKMMQEVADMVKPGGYLLLQIPIYDYSRECESWTGVSCWSIHEFYSAAKACGLEPIEVHTNEGEFAYNNIGPNHHEFQVLKKIS